MTEEPRTSVLIVDDHRLLAEVLRNNLVHRGMSARVFDLDAAVDLSGELIATGPDLVVLDLDLAQFGDGVALIAPLTAAGIRVVVLSGTSATRRIAAAFEAGAFAFRSKTSSFDTLADALVSAAAADAPLDVELRRRVADELAGEDRARGLAWAPFERLTDREKKTLLALSQGRTVREIAQGWVVSETTVRAHVRGLLAKLEVSSQLAAVAAAMSTGWLAQAS